MATRRMIPTSFFRDPDIMLLGKDAQLVLIGLVLAADDYGRELAHAHLLGKQMGYTPKQMEAVLQELVANDVLLLYEMGRHRYYTLTRWWQWQTITPNRRVPSVHPLPPGMYSCIRVKGEECQHDACAEQGAHKQDASTEHGLCMQNASTTHAQNMHNPCQVNPGEENLRKVKEGEGELVPTTNVIPFPSAHSDSTSSIDTAFSSEEGEQATRQVASILKVPVDDALRRIVEDYAHDLTLNFFGEADNARAWIDDPKRNQNRKRMSPTWFRTWLKREHDQVLERQTKRQQSPRQATGTTGHEVGVHRVAPSPQGATKPPSLMNLEQHYHAAATGRTGKETHE